jgi:hypothetical protein
VTRSWSPRRVILLSMLGAAAILLAGGTRGIAQTSEPSANAELAPAEAKPTTHRRASKWFLNRVDALDRYLTNVFRSPERRTEPTVERFLGARGVDEFSQNSRIRVSPGVSWKEGEGFDADVRLAAKLDLPRFENRMQLIIENFSEDENVLDDLRNQRFTRTPVEEESGGSVRVRVKLRESKRFHSSADAGLSFRPDPVPKSRLRFLAEGRRGPWVARATETLFWDSDDGFGERTRFDFDHRKTNHAERLSTSILWSESSEGVQLGETLGFLRKLSGRRAAGLKLGFSTHLEPVAAMDKYFVFGVFRSLIHRDYLFIEIEPGIEWPDDRDWKETPYINIQFDFMLGATEDD